VKKLIVIAIIAILVLYFLKAFTKFDYKKAFDYDPMWDNALDKEAKSG